MLPPVTRNGIDGVDIDMTDAFETRVRQWPSPCLVPLSLVRHPTNLTLRYAKPQDQRECVSRHESCRIYYVATAKVGLRGDGLERSSANVCFFLRNPILPTSVYLGR